MAKNKTHQGMKKRVKRTASGKLKRKRAYQSHLLTKKDPQKKRLFRQDQPFSSADRKNVKKLIAKA
jgi:large subunit ribosomal protein L35